LIAPIDASRSAWLRRISILLVLLLLLGALPSAAQQALPRNPEDRMHVLHDLIVDSNSSANVVQCFGCNVYVRGHVRGDVFTLGGSIYISGPVDGNAFAFGGHIDVRPGGELRGHAAAFGGYITQAAGGKIDRGYVAAPYAIVPGQYRPTSFGMVLLLVINLLCVSLACMLMHAKRVDNTAWTIWNRTGMVLVMGFVALLFAWGFESMGEHLGRAEVPANTLIVVLIAVIGSAGATGMGRMVAGMAFPGLKTVPATLAGISALTMLEVIPLLGFVVFAFGLLISLGAAIVSGFGKRAVPSPEEEAHPIDTL
jgi:hypothetical protein